MDALPFILTGLLLAASPEQDKRQHIAAGAAVSFTANRALGLTPLQSCGVALAAGILKEAYDDRNGGVVDHGDVLATAAGGCAMSTRF